MCIGGLLNKITNDSIIDKVCTLVQSHTGLLYSRASSTGTKGCVVDSAAGLSALVWAAKALVLRAHPMSTALLERLFGVFDQEALGLVWSTLRSEELITDINLLSMSFVWHYLVLVDCLRWNLCYS